MKDIFKNNIKRRSIITCIILIIFSLSFGLCQYQDYMCIRDSYENIISHYNNIEKSTFISVLIDNTQKSSDDLLIKNERIIESINLSYTSKEQLKEDIINPSDDSKLSYILDENLKESYINKDSKNNHIFVATLDNIVWNRSNIMNDNENDSIVLWNQFHSYQLNEHLAKQAYDKIAECDYNDNPFIFWQSSNSVADEKIKVMDINNIYDIYTKYGIEELKHYEILVPSYITNDGDILGNQDISASGIKKSTYKMVIIQRINVYDALSKYNTILDNFESYRESAELSFNNQLLLKVAFMFIYVLGLIIFFIISANEQNKYIKNTRYINEIKDKKIDEEG